MLVLFLGPDYGFDSGAVPAYRASRPGRRGTVHPLYLRGRQVRRPQLDHHQRVAPAGPGGLDRDLPQPGVSFSTLLIVSSFAGVGGGNFASSMTNINAFYPARLKGWARCQRRRWQSRRTGGGSAVGLLVLATLGTSHPRGSDLHPVDHLAAIGAAHHGQPHPAEERERCHPGSLPPFRDLDMSPLYIGTRVLHRLRLRVRAGAARSASDKFPHP